MPWSRAIRLAGASAGISSSRRSSAEAPARRPDGALRSGALTASTQSSAGVTVNHVPSPTRLDTSMRPPCASVSSRAIARPSPAPGSERSGAWKNSSKMNGRSASAMPRPRSSTETATGACRSRRAGDDDVRARRGVLDPVPDQVREHLADAVLVARDGRVAGPTTRRRTPTSRCRATASQALGDLLDARREGRTAARRRGRGPRGRDSARAGSRSCRTAARTPRRSHPAWRPSPNRPRPAGACRRSP